MKSNYFKNLSAWIFLLLISFIAALFLFGMITHEVLGEKEETVDMRVFSFLSAHIITPQLTGIMKVITNCASATLLPIAFGAIVLFYLLRKNRNRRLPYQLFHETFLSPPKTHQSIDRAFKKFQLPKWSCNIRIYLLWFTGLPGMEN